MALKKPNLRIHDPSDESSRSLRRGIFLVPNVITTAALFAGFFAIVTAMNGNFIAAAIAIFVAMILDAADGRVARMMHTESEFGAQYDSLADVVSFGVAPALLVFEWGVGVLQQLGWAVTFIYMACAALRLARFNTTGDSLSFTGLPSPMAAGLIASAVWIWTDFFTVDPSLGSVLAMALLVVLVGLLMVSNFEYFSPKLFHVRGRVPFVTLVVLAIALSALLADPPVVLFVVACGYALSGPVKFFWTHFRHGKSDVVVDKSDDT